MRPWRLLMLGTAVCMTLGNLGLSGSSISEAAAPAARVTPAGDSLELEYSTADGTTATEVIPLYKVGAARYFSAGIGMEERTVQYPPFPLKLVFIAGAKAYATHVAVTIKNTTGAVSLLVPDEHVTGPWLFVDVPAGTYDIHAIRRDGTGLKQRVEVGPGHTKVVYFRWKE